MRKTFISLVVAIGMIMGIGVVAATGAQAETRAIGSTSFTSLKFNLHNPEILRDQEP